MKSEDQFSLCVDSPSGKVMIYVEETPLRIINKCTLFSDCMGTNNSVQNLDLYRHFFDEECGN